MNAIQLAACTGARIDRAEKALETLLWAMNLYNINTPARQAMFLANIGHETGGLKWMGEIWGPTPAQLRYEGRADLGNTKPGDGRKFAGNGYMQTTGRFNHVAVRDRLRKRFPDLNVPDFETNPAGLREPKWAALSACDYVDMKGCNKFADTLDFDGYCDTVNRGRKTSAVGDSNGWADRLAIYTAATKVLP